MFMIHVRHLPKAKDKAKTKLRKNGGKSLSKNRGNERGVTQAARTGCSHWSADRPVWAVACNGPGDGPGALPVRPNAEGTWNGDGDGDGNWGRI